MTCERCWIEAVVEVVAGLGPWSSTPCEVPANVTVAPLGALPLTCWSTKPIHIDDGRVDLVSEREAVGGGDLARQAWLHEVEPRGVLKLNRPPNDGEGTNWG